VAGLEYGYIQYMKLTDISIATTGQLNARLSELNNDHTESAELDAEFDAIVLELICRDDNATS
jgi:hypothetical protein